MNPLNFPDFASLSTLVENKRDGHFVVTHLNCNDYPGMVHIIIVVFDVPKNKYQLNLEWSSYGLDFYGDTLMESYSYQFESLEDLINYLLNRYSIAVTDIPLKYQFDMEKYPNPLKDSAGLALFEEAWQRFQEDFKKGIFLEPSLKLVKTNQQ